jgi:acyl phosphate:glycerol-3-phosphate acyltransferase
MVFILYWFIGGLIGYVLGAFPTGFFAAKLWNIDVRKHGSGRTGGTNVLRTAGWGAFAITVIGDVLKGVVAVLLARALFPETHGAHAAAVLGVLIGHNWSLWIALLAKPDPHATFAAPPLGWIQRIMEQGRGGAGVSPTVGAAATLFPPVLLVAWLPLLVLAIWRYASLASLTVAVIFPIEMFVFSALGYTPWSYFVLGVIVGVILIIVHRPNIKRLMDGNERRFGQRLAQRSTK